MSAVELGAFALLGLAGSAHCVGMCGGLAIAATAGARRPRDIVSHAASYIAGKSLAYALIGAVLALAFALAARGAVGAAELGGVESDLALDRLRSVLAWLTGGALVLAGVHLLWRSGAGGTATFGSLLLQRLLAPVRRLPAGAGAFGVGVSSGFLPCGLSWSAFALAVPRPAAEAFVGLFVFGLATAPALVGATLGAGWARRRLGARLRYVAAPVLVVVGCLTIARGGLPEPLEAAEEAVVPACCQEPSRVP